MAYAAFIPLAASAIGAGGSILGGALGGAAQSATNAQNFQNSELMFNQQQQSIPAAQIQAEENAYAMRGSAYQATMDDMKKAGLNPILAANLGATQGGTIGGMSTGGSMAPMVSPGGAIQSGITSAAGAASTYAAVKAQVAQSEKDDAATKVNEETAKLTQASTSKTRQDEATSKSGEALNNATALTKVSEAASNMANANSANAVARVNTRVAEDTERYGDSPISKAIGSIFRMINSMPTSLSNSAKSVQDNVAPAVKGAFGTAGGDNPIVQERIRQNRLRSP